MAFRTLWINEPHLIGTVYSGNVSLTDLEMSMLEYLGVLQSHKVYILLDFSQAVHVPTSILRLSSMSLVMNHANTQWLGIVSTNQMVSNTTRLLVRQKIKMFSDRNSAIGFLRGMARLDLGVKLAT